MSSIPSAQEQLDFLTKIQRLFNESDFSSTYKYALLISLADLAIELGKDDDSPLELSNRQIVERKFKTRKRLVFHTPRNASSSFCCQ